jgi:hypothetical protein
MKRGTAFVLVACAMQPGCAFFGVERVVCLTEEDCPENGDGDGDPTGGAFGDGDGDGDGDSGGSPSGGGSGGQPFGDTGGSDTGGGDTGGGDTGGSDTGGGNTGGVGTGGQGTGGSQGTELEQLARALKINEIHPGYVEIYLTDHGASEITLDDFIIVVDGDYTEPRCRLDGAQLSPTDRYLVVQIVSLGESCFGGATNCVTGCTFTIDPGSRVQLRKDIMGSYELVSEVWHTDSSLGSGNSYRATTDGGDTFSVGSRSPGQPN